MIPNNKFGQDQLFKRAEAEMKPTPEEKERLDKWIEEQDNKAIYLNGYFTKKELLEIINSQH